MSTTCQEAVAQADRSHHPINAARGLEDTQARGCATVGESNRKYAKDAKVFARLRGVLRGST